MNRGYLPERAKDLAYRFYLNQLSDEEIQMTKICTLFNKGYWVIRGYSEEYAIDRVREIQSYNGKRCLSKYTKEERRVYKNTSIEYFLNRGFSEEEAKKELRKRQITFSLEKLKIKYGVEEGTRIWQDRQIRWQNTLNSKSEEEKKEINKSKGITLERSIAKFGEEKGKEYYYTWLNNYLARLQRIGFKRYSKESLLFFEKIFSKEILDNSCYKENEYYIKDNGKIYFYDFKYKNVIVEYHGHLYHYNSLVENEKWVNPFGITKDESIKKDEFKRNLAIKNGFKFFEIYSNDPDEIKKDKIQQILEAIHEENNNEIV